MATSTTKPTATPKPKANPVYVPVYVIDPTGVTGLEDANGTPIGTPIKGMIAIARNDNAELGKKLFTAPVLFPEKIEEAVKAYNASQNPPAGGSNDESEQEEKPKKKRKTKAKKD